MAPTIIFCEDPLSPRHPDSVYVPEVNACQALGLDYAVVSYETLVDEGRPNKAVRYVPEQRGHQTGIYRGWMLRPATYERLYHALSEKGIVLINTPEAYQHTHYLPDSYPLIAAWTPKSVWMPIAGEIVMDEFMALLAPFGSAPLVLKDYVKSQKHYWEEACFIPSANDRGAVERVIRRFLELQGDDLNVGLVFREFVELEPLATHSKSGMPLTVEFRVFVLDGQAILVSEYWEEGDYQGVTPPVEQFRPIMQAVKSQFFTMDIAQKHDGQWMITELGDAQVAGLPEKVDPRDFYKALAAN